MRNGNEKGVIKFISQSERVMVEGLGNACVGVRERECCVLYCCNPSVLFDLKREPIIWFAEPFLPPSLFACGFSQQALLTGPFKGEI